MRLGVARAVSEGTIVDGDVEVEDGRVSAVGVAPSGRSGIAIPGFVDIQVNGFGGIDFAAATPKDYTDTKLGLPEVRLGVMPGSGGTQRLPRVVGIANAKELILMGEIISATEAAEIGLVNRVVAEGRSLDEAVTMAETIAARGPIAVREAKRALGLAGDTTLDEGLAAELDASERIFTSRDMLEGARAFFEKRQPRFTDE